MLIFLRYLPTCGIIFKFAERSSVLLILGTLLSISEKGDKQGGREVFKSHTKGSDIHSRHVQCWYLGDSISQPVPSMSLPDYEFGLCAQCILANHTELLSTSEYSDLLPILHGILSVVGTFVKSAVIFHAHHLLFIITAVLILIWVKHERKLAK